MKGKRKLRLPWFRLHGKLPLRNQTYSPLPKFHPLPESLLLEAEGQPSAPVTDVCRLRPIHAGRHPQPTDASDPFPTGSQSLTKILEECSVVVMDGEEEDRVSVRFR